MPPATQDAPGSPVRCTRTVQPARARRRATDSPMTPPPMTAKRAAISVGISAPFAGMTRIRCDGKGRSSCSGCAHSQSRRLPGTPVLFGLHASALRRAVHEPAARLAAARLYLCTDARRERGDLAEFADAALAGGVDIIQLRDKGSAGEQRFGPLEARDELAALRDPRRRGPPARRPVRGQRPRRHRPRGRCRRAAPGPGRPAAGRRPRDRRAGHADRPVHP